MVSSPVAAPLAGQHGVGGDGGAVDDQVDLREELGVLQLQQRGDLPQPVQEPARGVLRRARRLVRRVAEAVLVEEDEVGEGAADVDPDRTALAHANIPPYDHVVWTRRTAFARPQVQTLPQQIAASIRESILDGSLGPATGCPARRRWRRCTAAAGRPCARRCGPCATTACSPRRAGAAAATGWPRSPAALGASVGEVISLSLGMKTLDYGQLFAVRLELRAADAAQVRRPTPTRGPARPAGGPRRAPGRGGARRRRRLPRLAAARQPAADRLRRRHRDRLSPLLRGGAGGRPAPRPRRHPRSSPPSPPRTPRRPARHGADHLAYFSRYFGLE